jgi:hypothetical protein
MGTSDCLRVLAVFLTAGGARPYNNKGNTDRPSADRFALEMV